MMEFIMRSFAFALLAASAIATPAFAQGNSTAPFTGAHVEAIAGWDQLRNGDSKSGFLYGLGAGYDMQMGSLVVGAEGELSDSNLRRRAYDVSAPDDRLTLKAGRDLYIGGRVGGVIGGRTLLYAKAGYTNARVSLAYDAGTGEGAPASYRDRTNLDGVRLGAGAEYAIGPNAFLKAEYRYSNYEKGFSRNQVVGGFGMRF